MSGGIFRCFSERSSPCVLIFLSTCGMCLESVAFYEKVFGVPPQKQTADYAKFDLIEPALNFSLLSRPGESAR